ncbi:MAG: hypothetical protein KatS3mg105_4372 [Gemmatales bacterium]|nr:MAG: hypothetical protein KatS3mg105_4372 [Gemmatales bacterium]
MNKPEWLVSGTSTGHGLTISDLLCHRVIAVLFALADFVEDAVDETWGIFGAEPFRQFDGFIQDSGLVAFL